MMSAIVNADNKEIISKILKENDTFLFDCDGVLWETGHPFPGSAETIKKLHALGKKVLFVTNNSTKTREQYLEKITQYGIEAKLDEVYCTSYTCALYLKKQNLAPDDVVYMVGNTAIATELDNVGIKHFGDGRDDSIISLDVTQGGDLDPNVKAVITGFDGYFSFAKLTKATSYLWNKDILFVATNMDANFPLQRSDYRLPGTGALISSVITATQRQPTVICGKPDSFMIECIREENDFDAKRAIMIGDRLDTDILFGKNNKLQTLVVMTGVTTHALLDKIQQSENPGERKLIPDYYLESVADLGKLM